MRLLTAIAMSLAMLLAGCGQVSGDVYLQTVGGSVQRIAGTLVRLVPATDGFTAAWSQVSADYEAEIARALEAHRMAAAVTQRLACCGPSWTVASDREIAALGEIYAIHRRAEKAALEMIPLYATAETRTDVDGRYTLPWVRPGKYYVCAAVFIPPATIVAWMVRTTLSPFRHRLDLAAHNAGWVFSRPQLPVP